MTLDVPQSIRRQRLFEQERVLLRVAPFAIAYVAAFAVFPFGHEATYRGWFAAAVVLSLASVASIAWLPWPRLAPALQVLPLLASLATVACLREAHGGARSGYAPLVLVPVLWAAVFGGRRMVLVVVAGVALTIGLPPIVDQSANYPGGELRRASILVLVSLLSGLVIQSLIGALLAAEVRLTRLRAAEVHDDLVQAFAVAQFALETGDTQAAATAVRGGLTAAQALATQMFADAIGDEPEPGSLRRSYGSASPTAGVDPA